MIPRFLQLILSKPDTRNRYGLDNLDDDVIGYPPTPEGIPVVQTEVLIERMEGDIAFIKNELGLSENEFEQYVRPVIIRFIEFADLLPAAEFKHHSTGGGLVYHSIDVAKRCMRAAQRTQFPVSDVSLAKTQQSNREWKTASVLSGLLHDAGKIVADMTIWNGDTNNPIVWDAHSDVTINEWARDNKLLRYFIKYNKNRHAKHHNASVTMMQRVISKETWSWLTQAEDGKAIHSTMLESVSNTNPNHVLSKLVAKADADSVRHDMLHNHSHITKEIKRVPLSELLCDQVKHRVRTDQWKVNQKNAKLWFIDDDLYVLWDISASELIDELLGAGYMIPQAPDALARICIEEGVAVTFDDDNLYTPIKPEILGTKAKPVTLKGLKFNRVDKLIPEPEKLYSITQHKDKRSSETTHNPEQVPAKENQKPVHESTPIPEKTSSFEPIISSLARILPKMRLVSKEPTKEAIPSPSQDVYFEHPIARRLFELGFQVQDGQIVIEDSEVDSVIGQLKESGISLNPFTPHKELLAVHEVTIR